MLDRDSAEKLGDRKLGELADMVSQFEVAENYTQINYHGRPVRVTPLRYGDIIKWFNNRSEGLPAYLIIDMVTQNVEVVRLDEGMKYTTAEHFSRNLYRHLRFAYPTYMFEEPVFEIDEDGTPYWVCAKKEKTIGLFGGTDNHGAVLVNAITGESEYYEEPPAWVDHVYSAELIIEQYDYYGQYHNGFWNSIFGQRDVTVTTDGYNYLAEGDDVYLYTGVTSVGGDESNIGFLLSNQRTKETKYYPCAGATEYSAMDSAEGQVQNLRYNATFPLLLNIAEQPTYFMALKDASELVKMYAMVNVNQYQIVAIGATVADCEATKWDADKQRVKNGCTNKLKQSASEINADLLKYYAEMQNVFKEFEVQETMPTTQQLKDAFNLRMKESSEEQQEEAPISFWEVFDEFVKECGNQNNWTASTYEKFAAVRNHIKEFKEDVTFEYFNEFGLNEYVNFLRDKKDMRNSTIGKQMGFLKWFLRWSFKKGHHQNIAYDAFKPKLKTTPKKVIFLTWDELNKLKDYHIPHDKQYLERVRDVFLFCCFTSLRYSDVRNLKRSDIKPDHIEVTTVKTADSLIIELNDHSKAILEKYKDVHFENHMALPVISNQKMNDYLKELGELAEINEPVRETYYKGNERIDEVTPKYALLSTHAGRKTFICNALALGIPAPVVMKWTGHSDYKAMKPYIDIADDIRANAMNKFNQL